MNEHPLFSWLFIHPAQNPGQMNEGAGGESLTSVGTSG